MHDLNKVAFRLYQNHTHAEIRPWKSAAHLLNSPLRENRILKDLNYKTFLFTVVKRNLLAIKMDKKTNKK